MGERLRALLQEVRVSLHVGDLQGIMQPTGPHSVLTGHEQRPGWRAHRGGPGRAKADPFAAQAIDNRRRDILLFPVDTEPAGGDIVRHDQDNIGASVADGRNLIRHGHSGPTRDQENCISKRHEMSLPLSRLVMGGETAVQTAGATQSPCRPTATRMRAAVLSSTRNEPWSCPSRCDMVTR